MTKTMKNTKHTTMTGLNKDRLNQAIVHSFHDRDALRKFGEVHNVHFQALVGYSGRVKAARLARIADDRKSQIIQTFVKECSDTNDSEARKKAMYKTATTLVEDIVDVVAVLGSVFKWKAMNISWCDYVDRVRLYRRQGLTYEQIAKICGISHSKVNNIIGHLNLRGDLKRGEYHDVNVGMSWHVWEQIEKSRSHGGHVHLILGDDGIKLA